VDDVSLLKEALSAGFFVCGVSEAVITVS